MADKPEHVENRNVSLPQDTNLRAEAHQSESIVTDLSQQPRKPHFQVLRMGLFAGILLACAAVALLPQWLVSAGGIRQLIVRSVPNLRGDVFVGAASIGWFAPLEIRDIEFRSARSGPTPIRIGSIKGTQGLLEIIRKGGRLGLITVNDTELHLAYDENHVSNLQETVGIEPQTRQLSNQPESTPPPQQPTGPLDERVRIAVKDARVRIDGPWTSTPWESDAIDVEAVLNQYTDGTKEWALTPVTLLDHAQLNPSVAAGALAYAAPILANTTRASGEFSLVIDEARWIAGEEKKATIDGNLTLHAVDIGPGPMVAKIIAALPGQLPVPPTVRIAESSKVHFRKSDRRIRHEGLAFGIPLKTSGDRLDITSEGSVGIDDRSIDLTLSLPIPDSLPTDRPLFAALAGKTIKASVEGTLDDPKLQLDASLKRTAADVATDFIRELRNKKNQTPPEEGSGKTRATPEQQPLSPADNPGMKSPKSQKTSEEKVGNAKKLDQLKGLLPTDISDDPTTDAVIDAVGGILDEVAKRRAEREQMKSKESSDTPQQDRPARRFLKKLLDAGNNETSDDTADKSQ
ncbi:MAG: AsmA-like C-terminal region-containing protein [Pirellulales bacterium]|nr:AsmA-like C-terminal region-containing protein [Pirellulales bacterium]